MLHKLGLFGLLKCISKHASRVLLVPKSLSNVQIFFFLLPRWSTITSNICSPEPFFRTQYRYRSTRHIRLRFIRFRNLISLIPPSPALYKIKSFVCVFISDNQKGGWIQVDLLEAKTVTGIITQGRQDDYTTNGLKLSTYITGILHQI